MIIVGFRWKHGDRQSSCEEKVPEGGRTPKRFALTGCLRITRKRPGVRRPSAAIFHASTSCFLQCSEAPVRHHHSLQQNYRLPISRPLPSQMPTAFDRQAARVAPAGLFVGAASGKVD